jgi:hypothetical protein
MNQSICGANPEAAIHVCQQGQYSPRQRASVWRSPSGDPNTVESEQPFVRSDPKIAIRVLSQYVDSAAEKPVFDLPRSVRRTLGRSPLHTSRRMCQADTPRNRAASEIESKRGSGSANADDIAPLHRYLLTGTSRHPKAVATGQS